MLSKRSIADNIRVMQIVNEGIPENYELQTLRRKKNGQGLEWRPAKHQNHLAAPYHICYRIALKGSVEYRA